MFSSFLRNFSPCHPGARAPIGNQSRAREAEAVAEPVVQIGAAPVAIPEVPAVPVKPAVKQQQRDAAVTEESRVLSPAEAI